MNGESGITGQGGRLSGSLEKDWAFLRRPRPLEGITHGHNQANRKFSLLANAS